MFAKVQSVLGAETALLAETGDSWFNGLKVRFPRGCRFEIQFQAGSIGWCVPAALGYELGSPMPIRVVAMIGDGSFQLTAQEVSTMVRYGVKPVIVLVNNRGYTIEAEIHDGPYNQIKNWDYAGPEESLEDLSTDRAAKHRISRVWVVLIPIKIASPGFVGMPTRSPKSQSPAIMTPATICLSFAILWR